MKYITERKTNFSIYTASVVKLFRQAKVKESYVADVDYVGFGQVKTCQASVFENMAILREDVVSSMLNSFAKAEGTYRMNLLECFSPIYWIQVIVFLPQKIFEYIGISEEKVISRVLQVVYWALTPALILFRSELYEFIISLFQNAQ